MKKCLLVFGLCSVLSFSSAVASEGHQKKKQLSCHLLGFYREHTRYYVPLYGVQGAPNRCISVLVDPFIDHVGESLMNLALTFCRRAPKS